MNEFMLQLLEKAKTDKKAFRMLKDLVIRCQLYEMAAEIRNIELVAFPETEDEKTASDMNLVLRMVEIKTDDSTSWVIAETMKVFAEKKGAFDMRDASVIIAKRNKLFA